MSERRPPAPEFPVKERGDSQFITRGELREHIDPIATELRELKEQVGPIGELATKVMELWQGAIGKAIRAIGIRVAQGFGFGVAASGAGGTAWWLMG